MSQELVAAITSSTSAVDPLTAIESHRSQMAAADMRQMMGSLPTEGGAMIQPAKSVDASQPSMTTLPALAGQFSDGLQHGFYTNDMARLVSKIQQSRVPNSSVTSGDVTLELLNVQSKMGIADALRSVTTKLSDGLNTVVVKQG